MNETQPTPAVAPTPAPIVSDVPHEHRSMGMLCHLLAFVGFIFPFGGLLAPLILWLTKRNEIPFVNEQGARVINFEITVLLAYLAPLVLLVFAFLLMVLIPPVGFIALILFGVLYSLWALAVFIYWLVMTIMGAVDASHGNHFQYPLSFRFIRT